jgi:hypothetical protein
MVLEIGTQWGKWLGCLRKGSLGGSSLIWANENVNKSKFIFLIFMPLLVYF